VSVDDFDLIVVGGGGAGLMAAVTAAECGMKVVLLEKGRQLGGTTALSVGSISASQTSYQTAAGIEDSPASHVADLEAATRRFGIEDDPALRALLAEHVGETVEVLKRLGVVFLGPFPQPPSSADRMHQVVPTSKVYIQRLEQACRKLAVKIILDCRASTLIAEAGNVVGVLASHASGGELRLRSKHGVILATGSMEANEALLRQFIKSWPSGIAPWNPLATGDGHVMACEVGGRVVHRPDMGPEHVMRMRFVAPPRKPLLQSLPLGRTVTAFMAWAVKRLPSTLTRPFIMSFITAALRPDPEIFKAGAILVNKQGNRVGGDIGIAELSLAQEVTRECWLILDDRLATKFSRWPHFVSTAPGVGYAYLSDYKRSRPDLYVAGRTARELAAKLGIAGEALLATLESVNSQRDEEKRLLDGAYYALGPLKLWGLPAPVGLAVDTKLRVLDQNDQPLTGLFAAGNTGQGRFTVSGHGHGLAWAFTSGRLAAAAAAELANFPPATSDQASRKTAAGASTQSSARQ
jgi:FAD binding domain